MRQAMKGVGILLVGALVAAQFVPPSAKPAPVPADKRHMAEMTDPRVGAILDRSCQDCHSGNTQWPWYGRMAPVSWLLSRDVNRGLAKLDFSHWSVRTHSVNERMEICDAVSNGSMPLGAYTVIHPNAKLSKRDIDLICDWAASPVSNEQTLRAELSTTAHAPATSSHVRRHSTKGSR